MKIVMLYTPDSKVWYRETDMPDDDAASIEAQFLNSDPMITYRTDKGVVHIKGEHVGALLIGEADE